MDRISIHQLKTILNFVFRTVRARHQGRSLFSNLFRVLEQLIGCIKTLALQVLQKPRRAAKRELGEKSSHQRNGCLECAHWVITEWARKSTKIGGAQDLVSDTLQVLVMLISPCRARVRGKPCITLHYHFDRLSMPLIRQTWINTIIELRS